MLIAAQRNEFGIGENKRNYVVFTVPYATARVILKVHVFKGQGDGEQRSQVPGHIKKLRQAIESNNYTPTAFNASTDKHHEIQITEKHGKAHVEFETDETKPLRLVDGQQRMAALEQLYGCEDMRDSVSQLPITVFTYLDGNPKADFIKLQLGKAVDRAHMLTLQIQQKEFSDDINTHFKIALQIARNLASRKKTSPISGIVRFSSVGTGIPISTFLSKNGSDIACSLFGSAKITSQFEQTAQWFTDICHRIYEVISEETPQILECGKILCPPPEGNAGGSSLLIGICNIVAYRCAIKGIIQPTDQCITRLISTVVEFFDIDAAKQMSLQHRREYLGDFTAQYLDDIIEPLSLKVHEGIPVPLLLLLSASTFNRSKIEPMRKDENAPKRGRPRKTQQ
jgi:hypothetical protein